MIEPWEPLFAPVKADAQIYDTFAGVGHVLSEWEGIEVGLCRIYSFFVGDPDGIAMKSYGEPPFFRGRFAALQEAADRFFVSYPCQELEGTLQGLSEAITGYSDRRNQVAHGIVMPINEFSFARQIVPDMEPRTNYYALMPPYFQVRRHNLDGFPDFIYGAEALHEIACGIAELYPQISTYREELRAASWKRGRR